MSLWHRHPAVRSGDDLTIGERAADRMRNSFGSWTFIAATMLFIALWIYLVIYIKVAIDNHQLTILNLILSCFAAMQGAIILLAAKRADAVSSELALHTFQNGEKLLGINTQQLGILTKLDGLDGKVADLAEAVAVVTSARTARGDDTAASLSDVLAEVRAVRALVTPAAPMPAAAAEAGSTGTAGQPPQSGMGSRLPKRGGGQE